MSGFLGALAATYMASGGGGGTATAPSLVGSAVGQFTSGTTADITATLTGAVAGNTAVVVVSCYLDATVIDPVVTSSGYTFTSRGGLLQVGADVGCRVFTAPIPSSGNPVFTCSNAANYKSIVVLQLANNHADIIDVAPASTDLDGIGSAAVPITLATTTFSHDYILAAFFWYDSDRVHTIDAAWPQLFAWNGGQSDRNQIIVVGKAVTATGDYAPFITAGTPGTSIGGIAIAFKGVTV